MKYIDAEKMIAFLEKVKAEHIIGGDYSNGVLDTCDNIIAFIDSLQQEQPEVNIVTEYDTQFDSDPVYGKLANRNAGIAIALQGYYQRQNNKYYGDEEKADL